MYHMSCTKAQMQNALGTSINISEIQVSVEKRVPMALRSGGAGPVEHNANAHRAAGPGDHEKFSIARHNLIPV
jgi:hypothetical protein